MIRELIPHNDPLLRTESEVFDFATRGAEAEPLARDLVETMMSKRGLGLSAIQVGVPLRVFVLNSEPKLVFFNPRVVHESEMKIDLDEGCLSFPGLYLEVTRPRDVRVRYQEVTGETVTNVFTGMTGRAVLHEIDHLNGKLFFDRVSRFHRDRAMRKWSLAMRKVTRGKARVKHDTVLLEVPVPQAGTV